MSEALAGIEDLLARHIGLDVGSVGSRAIAAAIGNRMAANRILDPGDYLALLARADELAALIDEVVVPETWFLRDRHPFAHLASHARDVWRGQPIRVLSVPCSTGEEPYSIAIALLDAGVSASDIAVDALDISDRNLSVARRGIYGSGSFRGVDPELRERWFRRHADGWEVRPQLRELVSFTRGNVLDPGAFEPGRRYRAVFCRNLLIYLTGAARQAAIGRLEPLLDPGGLFIVGHAESLQVMDPRFRAVDVAGSFTFARVSELPHRPTPAAGAASVRAAPRRAPTRPPVRRPTRPVPAIKPPPAGPAARDRLTEAAALADRGDLAGAAALCEQHLEAIGADAATYALLGTIRQAAGDTVEAEACFTRALYCDPGHYPSLVQLALLRERRGDDNGAANLRRRAAKARGGEP